MVADADANDNNEAENNNKATSSSLLPVLPDQVEVIGAGTEEVNGIYIRNTEDNDRISYEKQGTWKGEVATFGVSKGCCMWYIYAVLPGADSSGDEDGEPAEFYICRSHTEDPPEADWCPTQGNEPSPIVWYGEFLPLDWRIDPQKSHSDWTIRVTSQTQSPPSSACEYISQCDNVHTKKTSKNHTAKTDKDTTIIKDYHVHLNMITMGKRASGYFRRVCNTEGFSESNTRVSCIDLHPMAAEQFPVFLDYCYNRELRLRCDRHCTIVLLYLARYFDCPELVKTVDEIVADVLSPECCGDFLQCAVELNLFDVITSTETWCVENIMEIKETDTIVTKHGSLEFWMTVLSKVDMATGADANEECNIHVSSIVSSLCKLHKEVLDKSIFESLTSKLTSVSFDAASTLLELEQQFLGVETEATSGGNSSNKAGGRAKRRRTAKDSKSNSSSNSTITTGSAISLTTLQTVCLAALVKGFGKPSSSEESGGLFQLPTTLPPLFYTQLLQQAHQQQQQQGNASSSSQANNNNNNNNNNNEPAHAPAADVAETANNENNNNGDNNNNNIRVHIGRHDYDVSESEEDYDDDDDDDRVDDEGDY